ncbi:hypothetical protein RVU96_16830 [Bordetella avium]|uniref:hypothetical protein n=1 Tax=Bordetella avium TaxID=521 RepID=UPI000E0A69EF|nr:hypothetical protein [Bordetella avium]RIQ11581.1 hypothetical protein D0432_16360 [Bordetella avium]RIQ44920.1 hypothetical protein D0845_17080 [Bordetella avium]RIQ49570.1 hypothetical protein D0844_16375 [Bordetella avium]RIQ55333.1 hypothetical protein D0841_16575 [Bordetella avium]RIQ58415.1 hypothetical protein D0842_16470 [Bordetella avium]
MSYAEAAAAVSHGQAPQHDHRLCSAPGCVLPGTISDSTTGTVDWLCSLHHGAPHSEYAGISARMGNRRKLLILAQRLSNAGTADPVPEQVTAWIKAQGRGDLLPSGPATCRHLGSSMLRILADECRAPQARMGNSTKDSRKPDSWSPAADAARAFLGGLA